MEKKEPNRLLTLEEWMTHEFDPPVWLIDPLMEAGTGAWVHGPAGAYKSWFFLRLCLDIAAGMPPLGTWNAVPPVPVILFQAEGTKRGWQDRIKKVKGEYSNDIPFHTIHEANTKVDSVGGRKVIERLIESVEPKLLVFDPLVTWFTGSDGVDLDIRRWLDLLNEWRTGYDTAIMIGAHNRQPKTYQVKGTMVEEDRGREEMRGRTEMVGWADLIMGMKKVNGVSTLTVEKSRDEAEGTKYKFSFDEKSGIYLTDRGDKLTVALRAYLAAGEDSMVGAVVRVISEQIPMVDRTVRRKIDALVKEGKFTYVGDGARKSIKEVI